MATASEATSGEYEFKMAAAYKDANALKNYAAGMASMSGMYWPTAFDSAGMFNAYSSAQALAAAANSMSMNGNTGNCTAADSTTGPANMAAANFVSSAAASLFTSPLASTVTRTLAHSTTMMGATPKKKAQPVPDTQKDDQYWDRRKRNNESARRSRESRRIKEEQIAMRVVYLEQENLQLKTECTMLRGEIEKLRMILCNSTSHRC